MYCPINLKQPGHWNLDQCTSLLSVHRFIIFVVGVLNDPRSLVTRPISQAMLLRLERWPIPWCTIPPPQGSMSAFVYYDYLLDFLWPLGVAKDSRHTDVQA